MRARRLVRRVRWVLTGPARKLATLSAAQWRYLLHAQGALLWAQALVWVRPLGRLVDSSSAGAVAPTAAGGRPQAAGGRPQADDGGGPPPPVGELPRQLALGVRRAAAYGVFRPLCLVRSVALSRMLEHYGIHGSRIRVGVRWADGQFAAHAWVEYHGQVLGDDEEHVSRFADLSEVRVLKWS